MSVTIYPKYSVAIRTLGKAGDKYQCLLDSLQSQTHPPEKIFVYLAEGYEKPKETINTENIVYVPKGMVAQRALPYNEVSTEWMLLLDDDMKIEPQGVENLFKELLSKKADVIAIDAFPHHLMPLSQKVIMTLLLSSFPRIGDKNKGYTLSVLGTDIYNPAPKSLSSWSTTNSGAVVLCRKKDFLNIHFERDLWLDRTPYALPDDKVMFYKMHLNGLKILTYHGREFIHLDASSVFKESDNKFKLNSLLYSSTHNNYIFSNLYLFPRQSNKRRIFRYLLKVYQIPISYLYFLIKKRRGEFDFSIYYKAKKDAKIKLKELRKDL